MFTLPRAAEPLVRTLAPCFSDRVFRRFVLLLVGAVLAPRRRCVTSVLRVLGPLADGHFSSYHRALSHAQFSMWRLGRVLARLVVAAVPGDEPIVLAVDDTVARHGGPKVYGRCCHRDPVRSSHGITVFAWGHRWVVMAVVVRFPGLSRPWALPVLACLYRSEKWCDAHGRRFKSWPVMARQMAAAMLRWFPRRRFVLLGGGGFATHDLACLAHRHRGRLTFVCRFYDDAALTALPKPKARLGRGMGRPPKYGAKLPGPGVTVARAGGRLAHARVGWYGGGRRDVRLLSGVGGWQRSARPLVPVRWVYVRDDQGTHRDDYPAATDPALRPEQVVGLYTLRWPLETTFQECRAHLGLETPRQRSERSVLRTTPLLLGLFTLVTLIWRRCPRAAAGGSAQRADWYEKAEPTFTDALLRVRELLWRSVLSATPPRRPGSSLKAESFILPLIRTLTLAA
jgi:hypothetical protein